VGRVLGHPYGFVDRIAKLIPFEIGMALDKAVEQEAELRRLYESDEEVRTLIELARKLEGLWPASWRDWRATSANTPAAW